MSIFSSFPFNLASRSMFGGFTEPDPPTVDKVEGEAGAKKKKSSSNVKDTRKTGNKAAKKQPQKEEEANVRVAEAPKTEEAAPCTVEASIVKATRTKKKNRSKNKNGKGAIQEETGEVSTPEAAATPVEVVSEHSTIELHNDTNLKINKWDPNWMNMKTQIDNFVKRYIELQQSMNVPVENLLSEYKEWMTSLEDLKSKVKSCISEQGKRTKNVAVTNAPINSSEATSMSSRFTHSFISLEAEDENDGDDERLGVQADKSEVKAANEAKMISTAVSENKKLFKQFITQFRDDVVELSDTCTKAFEKAKENAKKERFMEKYNELRSRLGLTGVVDTSDITVSQSAVSSDAIALVPHPTNLWKKLTNIFPVLILPAELTDRPGNQRNPGINLIGLSEDVKKCLQFIQNADLSGKEKIELDTSKISALIGRSGSVINKLQADFEVLIYVENECAVFYGLQKNIEKVKIRIEEILKQVKERRLYEGVSIPKLTYQVLSRFFAAEVKAIGNATDTTIMLLLKNDSGRAGIQGKTEASIAEAKTKLDALINTIVFTTVCEDPEVIKSFWNQKEFANLKNGRSYFLQESEGKLILAGTEAVVQESKAAIENALKVLSYPKISIKCHWIQLLLWRKKKDELTQLALTPTITTVDEEYKNFVLQGSPDELEKAKQQIESFLSDIAHTEEVELPEESMAVLRKNRYILRQSEESSGATCMMDRTQSKVYAVGTPTAVQKAAQLLISLLAAHSMDSTPITKRQIPVLIGEDGATIRRIRTESNISQLTIDEGAMVVKMHGTKESVKRAKELIDEVISKVPGGGSAQSNASKIKNRGEAVKEQQGTAAATVVPQLTVRDINFHDEASFPSLHDSMLKRRGGSRAQEKNVSSVDTALKVNIMEKTKIVDVEENSNKVPEDEVKQDENEQKINGTEDHRDGAAYSIGGIDEVLQEDTSAKNTVEDIEASLEAKNELRDGLPTDVTAQDNKFLLNGFDGVSTAAGDPADAITTDVKAKDSLVLDEAQPATTNEE